MAQARCRNGHIYDPGIYGENCPYCDRGTSTISFGSGASRDSGWFAQEAIGRTAPVAAFTAENIGKTVPTHGQLERREEIGKTVPVFQPKEGGDPVVGWLVCVSGHDVGKDFRLGPRINTIGRSSEMDVHIRDNAVTANIHARIAYDTLNNAFYLLPANNINIIYCNDTPVFAALKLNPYDRICFGHTELLFVPFCCERFTWPAAEPGDRA